MVSSPSSHTNTSLASLTSPIIVILHNLLSIFSSPGHCEPSPPMDHYHSPPHEGQIDPQVECPALHNLLSIFSIHLCLLLPNASHPLYPLYHPINFQPFHP